MKYADPQSCPRCRGPIGGVSLCPSCGFDLASPAARQLWDVFTQADRIIAQTVQAPTSRRVDSPDLGPTAAVAQAVQDQVSTPHPGTVSAPTLSAPTAPHINLTPGAILLGLGALSLVVAATIFVSLTWGMLGIAGRAAILLLLTCAFAVGLWFALKRRLPATSEALAFVVMAMVTINVSAAVAEGLFGLDHLHWGYPMLLWAGLILILSYWIQTTSQEAIDRSLYTVQLILGAAIVPATLAAVSFVDEFWPDGQTWLMVSGLPIVYIFLTFTHHLSQRLAWWMCLVWSLLWGAITTAYAWLMAGDSFSSGIFSGYAVIAVLALCGLAIAYRYPRIRSWALSYSIVNFAYMAAFFLVERLGDVYRVNHTIWWLVFLTIFVAFQIMAVRLVSESSTVLRWIAALSAAGLLIAWVIPVLAFLAAPRVMHTSFVSTGNEALWLPASAVIVGTAVLVVFSSVAVVEFMHDDAVFSRTMLRAIPALVLTLGIATALGVLAAPVLLIVAVFLFGAIAIVWFVAEDWPWQLVGIIPALLVIQLVKEPGWIFFVALTALSLTAAGIAWWLASKSEIEFALPKNLPVAIFAALGSWSGIYALWHLPGVAGAYMNQPYLYLALLVGGILLACLGLMGREVIRMGAELGAAMLGLFALGGLLAQAGTFALAAVVLAASCAIVALVDPGRRWQFGLAVVLALAAWIAQLIAWDIEVIEAYTGPIAGVLLIIGLFAMRNDSALSSSLALGAGLVLAFVPSLLGVWSEPASLRALLWGIVGAVFLGTGIALRWLAPVVAGGLALLIVIIANAGPLILDLDRWILFGVLGAALLAVGIRWEQNVIGGKALLTRLAQMR